MMQQEHVSYVVAFAAGFLTYLSPCLLPLIPSFIAYITGVSFQDLTDNAKAGRVRAKTAIHTILFILGFSVVFVALGLTATFLGTLLSAYQDAIRIGGGALIIVFGLYLAGVLKLDFLLKERRLNLVPKGATYAGSFLIGVTFAAAWTPCAGPILGSILVIAGTKSSVKDGALLLMTYSAGLAVPFFVTALLVNSFIAAFNRFKRLVTVINVIAGYFLVVVGILMVTGYMAVLSGRLTGLLSRG